MVSGQVLRSDGLPFKGALVRALHEGETGAIPRAMTAPARRTVAPFAMEQTVDEPTAEAHVG